MGRSMVYTMSQDPAPFVPPRAIPVRLKTCEASTAEQKSEPVTPATPTINVIPSDPWNTFTRTNAWDEMPEIERYVEGLQKHRRVKSQGSPGIASINRKAKQERGFRLTDFPSEVDRPSLPVTPAPIRRPKFWGGGDPGAGDGEDEEVLPVAEGVPLQSAWNNFRSSPSNSLKRC
ncbi:hypothetical protein EV126DRAFT_405249 [Verticillium dahliae]|nr:hypothetical protein EV126DRAFT_405249 [Verticillium dahliae]